jgi:hypothetical protein
MEYLPEKKRTQKSQVLKKEDKTRKFREYLANNDVVLSMVKCKLTTTTHSTSLLILLTNAYGLLRSVSLLFVIKHNS